MEQKTQNFWAKYGWLFAIGSAVLAILFLLLPILNYEIREAVYDTVTGDRLSKTDYVYNVCFGNAAFLQALHSVNAPRKFAAFT